MNLKNLQLNGMELVDPNADYSVDQVINIIKCILVFQKHVKQPKVKS